MSALSDEPMPLLCDLGWHRPDPIARWNDGYYFSKCSRCGRDLVRTAFGQWQVPKGYRVVWQQKPPETREEIALVPETAGEIANGAEQPATTALPPVREPEQPVAAEPVQAPAFAATAEPEVLAARAEASQRDVEIVEQPEAPADEPLLPLNGPADDKQAEAVVTIEPRPAEQMLPDHFPIEDLIHQSNGTGGHEVHESTTAVLEHPAPAPSEERQELPIQEVLRHLQSTPLPPMPTDGEASEKSIGSDELNGAGMAAASPEAPVDDQAVEEPSAEDGPIVEAAEVAPEEAPVSSDEVASEVSEEEAAVGTAEVHEGEAPAVLQRDLPEPHFEPHVEAPEPPAERVLRPIKRYSSDWDFMKEDEEDPITTFWEQIEPPAGSAEPIAEERSRPATALTEQVQDAPSGTAAAERVPTSVESEQQRSAPIPVAIERPPLPEAQSGHAVAAIDPAPASPLAEYDEPAAAAIGVDETPPWVDGTTEGEGEEEAPRSRRSRFAVTALVSAAILALVAFVASQPNGAPVRSSASTPPVANPAAAPPLAKEKDAAPKASAKARSPARRENAAAALTRAPVAALPGRGLAFVSASVLQCRSAPVDRAAPVRKLVRGAEVQILAREGEWMSIAHKGRQCWAAARFLSAAEPW